MSSPVKVQIFGQTYTIHGELDAAYVQKLAAYVDQKMSTIADATSTIAANPHLKLIFGYAAETPERDVRLFDAAVRSETASDQTGAHRRYHAAGVGERADGTHDRSRRG